MGALAHLVTGQEDGPLGRYPTKRVEGTTWRWELEPLLDATGVPMTTVAMEALTCVCRVYDFDGGVVASPAYSVVAAGVFALSVDETATADLASSGGEFGRHCRWAMSLSDGTDTVQFWAPTDSPFLILPADL